MNAKRGFTLIETVVALGILTFALAGTLTLIFQAVNLSMNARNVTTGNALMQQRLADAVSLTCNGCTPTTTMETRLGPSSTVNIDDTGAEQDTGGHQATKYSLSNIDRDGILYTGEVYVDKAFSPVTDGTVDATDQIDNTNFIKIISKVSWGYKGVNYSKLAVQYVKGS